ncbi:hypothetical protein [Mucilaginibacter xinganensis]|uniref:Uncharacterized protein n=1 Tax=Mucilaginibacter xinganensis TaxID=1234841 RepID=A0A223NW25_9SPHI|nr:hypothetical protein [Mucilaginibacter xinganensis]ASU34072.1 hypothetical protein MuYL_2182 [Mucilaginibacter xinganensis]
MNNIFNAKRFTLLFIKQLTEHYKTYLMSLTVLLGVMLVGGSFLVYLIPAPIDLSMQTLLFVAIYFLAGAIFTSIIFTDLGDRKKAIGYLTLPASHFEKFLVGWLFSYVIFSLIYTGCFYLILMLLLSLKHWPHQHTEVFNVFAEPMTILFVVFSLLHSIAMWGAVFFEKLHFIKTAFCFFISIVVLTLMNTRFIETLIKREVRPATPFSNIMFFENNRNVAVASIRQNDALVIYILIFASLILWAAAYYRLKEKQV